MLLLGKIGLVVVLADWLVGRRYGRTRLSGRVRVLYVIDVVHSTRPERKLLIAVSGSSPRHVVVRNVYSEISSQLGRVDGGGGDHAVRRVRA